MSPRCSKSRMYAMILILCVLFVMLNIISMTPGVDHTLLRDNFMRMQQSRSLNHIDAVVLIAAGKHATNTMIDQCVASLRQSGLSNTIPILILTDNPQCVSMGSILSDFVNIDIISTGNQSRDSLLSTGMDAKLLKMTMFQYIPSNINTVLYLDIDILASSIFNEHLIPSFDDEEYLESNCSIIIQPGRPGVEKKSSGLFVAHRVHSRECLQEWADAVRSGIHERDQRALYKCKSCMRSMCTLPEGIMKWARNMKTFWTTETPPLIHYTDKSHGTLENVELFCAKFMWQDNWGMKLYCWGWANLKNVPIVGSKLFGKFFMIYQTKIGCWVVHYREGQKVLVHIL